MKGKYINFLGALILCFMLLYLGSCNNSKEREASSIEESSYASIESVLLLKNKENISSKIPIVSTVSLVTTDEGNNIYLVDPKTLKIHSYTSNLAYRWTTGGRGGGPSRYDMINALYADSVYLYVYDNANAMFVLYNLKGERITEWTFGESGHHITHIRRMNNGKFITTGWHAKSGTMIHIYSPDFKKRIAAFLRGEKMLKTKYPYLEKQVLLTYPGSAIPINDSTIVYAPFAYKGQLLIFGQTSRNQWDKIGVVEGYTNIEQALIFTLSSNGNNERSLLSGFNPKGGYFHTEFISISRGLYKLDNGQFAHLSIRLNENDTWDLVVEYFNPEKIKLIDQIIIEELIQSQQLLKLPIWMDKSGRIYLSTNSDNPLLILTIRRKPK